MKKILAIVVTAILATTGFTYNREKQVDNLRTIEEIENFEKVERIVPLTKWSKDKLKRKKDRERKVINNNIEDKIKLADAKIEELDFSDNLNELIVEHISKENKDKINKLKEKQEQYKKDLEELEKQKTIVDKDYKNKKLNEKRDKKNKELKEIIKQEEQKKKEKQAKKEKAEQEKREETQKQPYTITLVGDKTYRIVDGEQEEIDWKDKNAWVNIPSKFEGKFTSYNNNDIGLYLAAHREIGEVIEHTDKVIYTDPDGVSATYKFVGTTDLIDGNKTEYYQDDEYGNLTWSSDPWMPYKRAEVGNTIVFQTCIDYSGRSLAYGYIFEKEEGN